MFKHLLQRTPNPNKSETGKVAKQRLQEICLTVREKFKCKVLIPGSITVTAHILYDIIRKFTDGSEVLIEFTGSTASLSCNKSKFQLPIAKLWIE